MTKERSSDKSINFMLRFGEKTPQPNIKDLKKLKNDCEIKQTISLFNHTE